MPPINRMDDPVRPQTLGEAQMADPEVLECPFPTYQLLLEEAPVWQDPRTGMYFINKYEDLRWVLKDTETFSNWRPRGTFDARDMVVLDFRDSRLDGRFPVKVGFVVRVQRNLLLNLFKYCWRRKAITDGTQLDAHIRAFNGAAVFSVWRPTMWSFLQDL